MPATYSVTFPEYFDEYAHEIEAKGYFADLPVSYTGRVLRPVFYDPPRLAQEINDATATGAVFAVPLLAVVPAVTRDNIIAALDELAAGRFSDFGA